MYHFSDEFLARQVYLQVYLHVYLQVYFSFLNIIYSKRFFGSVYNFFLVFFVFLFIAVCTLFLFLGALIFKLKGLILLLAPIIFI